MPTDSRLHVRIPTIETGHGSARTSKLTFIPYPCRTMLNVSSRCAPITEPDPTAVARILGDREPGPAQKDRRQLEACKDRRGTPFADLG